MARPIETFHRSLMVSLWCTKYLVVETLVISFRHPFKCTKCVCEPVRYAFDFAQQLTGSISKSQRISVALVFSICTTFLISKLQTQCTSQRCTFYISICGAHKRAKFVKKLRRREGSYI
jgi:hypothetical protein